jgi:hypothetical protein
MTASAVVLSLPLFSLMWSVIAFSTALLGFAFQNTQGLSRVGLVIDLSAIVYMTICDRLFSFTTRSDPPPTPEPERVFHTIRCCHKTHHNPSEEHVRLGVWH